MGLVSLEEETLESPLCPHRPSCPSVSPPLCLSPQERTEQKPCEDTGRRQMSVSREGRPHRKPTPLTPASLASSLQNCGRIRVCGFSGPGCRGFLQQPRSLRQWQNSESLQQNIKIFGNLTKITQHTKKQGEKIELTHTDSQVATC